MDEAKRIFESTGIIIKEGTRDLGAAIGSSLYKRQYTDTQMEKWCEMMESLSKIALSSPQAAHSAFTHGLNHKWTFLHRTMPNIGYLFKPLEYIIRDKFIPALLGGRLVTDE